MGRGKSPPWRSRHRLGLTPEESETIRILRSRGYAVVFIAPLDVGSPLLRVEVEESMLRAGRARIRKTKETLQ